MMSIEDAKVIKNAVNNTLFKGKPVISLEDAAQMQLLPSSRVSDSISVLALQYGDMTIMAWVQFTEMGMRVRMVRSQAW